MGGRLTWLGGRLRRLPRLRWLLHHARHGCADHAKTSLLGGRLCSCIGGLGRKCENLWLARGGLKRIRRLSGSARLNRHAERGLDRLCGSEGVPLLSGLGERHRLLPRGREILATRSRLGEARLAERRLSERRLRRKPSGLRKRERTRIRIIGRRWLLGRRFGGPRRLESR